MDKNFLIKFDLMQDGQSIGFCFDQFLVIDQNAQLFQDPIRVIKPFEKPFSFQA